MNVALLVVLQGMVPSGRGDSPANTIDVGNTTLKQDRLFRQLIHADKNHVIFKVKARPRVHGELGGEMYIPPSLFKILKSL